MNYNYLRIEKTDQLATIILARPKCGNALSLSLMREIIDAANSFKYDTQTRVVMIKGQGKHFCVGADLKDEERWKAGESGDLLAKSRLTQIGRELIEALVGINQITIARLHGASVGGGACIPSACDFRIASRQAVLGYPEVKLGMNLSWGALPLCYNLVGPSVTKRLLVGGELETADNLLAWGFIDEVIEEALLDSRVIELAKFYAQRPPLAAQMIKRSINAIQMANSGIMHMDGDQNALATLGDDFKAARESFKRKSK